MSASQPALFNVQEFTDDGITLVGGRLYTYAYGTTAQKIAYTDPEGTIPQTYTADGLGGQYIALNARGELPTPLYLASTGSYDISLKRADGSTVWTKAANGVENPTLLLSADLAATTGSDLIGWKRDAVGATPRRVFEKLNETVSFSDFGVIAGATTDQSVQMQNAFNYIKLRGGTLQADCGVYLGRIDFSGSVKKVLFMGSDSEFRPFSAAQDEVFYCNNSTGLGTYADSNVVFSDVLVTARLLGAVSDTDAVGHVDYGVNFISSSAKWYNCGFQYGKIAAYRGFYHQYGEFHSCVFAAAVFSAVSAGGLFDSNTSLEASNENRLYSPRLFSNNNGLVFKGGIKNRIITPTIQDTRAAGTAGIWLTVDATGFGADGTTISGGYCELNHVPAILVGVAPNTDVSSVELLNSTIATTHCYNLALDNINSYGDGYIMLVHPGANADRPAVSIKGGNVVPNTAGLPSRTAIDQRQAGTRTVRNDNMMGSTGQAGPNTLPLMTLSQSGFKSAIQRGTITDLFLINQETFNTPQFRFELFKLTLFAIADPNAAGSFGYSAHVQEYLVFISNNTSGTPQCFIQAGAVSVDLGVSPAFTAPGGISLLHQIIGDSIKFQVAYSGVGSSPGTTAQIQVGYRIEGTSGNPVNIARF